MLRHSVPHFPPTSLGIECWLAELNAALCLANCVYSHTLVPLRHNWPQFLKVIYIIIFFYFIFQLHTVSRTQQGMQREPSVKTFRSRLSAELWRHCVLSGRIQFLEWRSDPRPVGLQSHFVPLRHDWPINNLKKKQIIIKKECFDINIWTETHKAATSLLYFALL